MTREREAQCLKAICFNVVKTLESIDADLRYTVALCLPSYRDHTSACLQLMCSNRFLFINQVFSLVKQTLPP